MKFGITGASGQLGTGLVRHTLARTSASNVVAITRNPAKLEQFSKQGIETRSGDFSQPAGLVEAFRGIERLVIVPTSELAPGVRSKQHADAIKAAVSAGVKHLIYISTVSPRPDPNNSLFDSHFNTEQALIASSANWTILRMAVYTDTLLDLAKLVAISEKPFAALAGAPAAYVVRDDIAAAAAGVLTTPGHAGITYHATGPVSVTREEIVNMISKASGKKIIFQGLTIEQHRAGLEAAKLPPTVVNGIVGFQAALSAGAFDLVTGDVERLSGKTAESPLQYFERNLGSASQASKA